MTTLYDVAAIGNAIVDVIAPASDDFLADEGLVKGSMTLIDNARAVDLYSRMAATIEASGGSAGNTVAGVASFGGRGVHIGKIGGDQLGEVFAHDMDAIGARFAGGVMHDHTPTGRCLINVTPDGERTMSTNLGAAALLAPEDVDPAVIEAARIVYLEGYLFDPEPARRAFAKAAGLARASDRLIALTLSDALRHRPAPCPTLLAASSPARSTSCSPTKPRSLRCSSSPASTPPSRPCAGEPRSPWSPAALWAR